MARRATRILAALVGGLLGSASGHAQDAAENPKKHAGWWIDAFGVLDPAQAPLVARAHAVFDRVAAAADKSGSRYPRFVIVRDKPGPFALALPDGTVILTQDGLDLCYRSVSESAGDSRLAFVVGHELSHLASDDFLHTFVPGAVRDNPAGRALMRSIGPLIARESRDLQLKELTADSSGVVFMTLAGFSPRLILGDQRSFLEEWVAQLPPEGAGPGIAPKQRAELLRVKLKGVADYTDFFHFGVRLYQLGRYEDAILLLEKFRDRFPGREVFSNLGLSRYQLAARAAMTECGVDSVLRFMLPTRLDPETLARRTATRGRPTCLESPGVRRYLEDAVRDLTEAGAKDPRYLPARINLASAFLLGGQNAQALAAAEEALVLAPNDPQALQAKALSLFLYGQQSHIETADFALALLSDLREHHPESAGVAYNLAVLLEERGRTAAAREASTAYLALEASGPFADAVRRRSGGVGPSAAPEAPALGGKSGRSSPVPLGEIQEGTARRLAALRTRPFEIGRFGGAIYDGSGLLLLQLDESIEIVEETVDPPATLAALGIEGVPLREIEGPPGRTLIYAAFACDVADQRVVRQVYFSR